MRRTRQKRKRISQIILDRKLDYRHVPGLYGRSHWVHLNVHDPGFKSGLQPPPGVEAHVWINIISALIAVRGMLVASAVCLANMLHFLVRVLNAGLVGPVLFPDFQLLLDVARAAPLSLWASKPEYANTLIQLLDGVVSGSTCFGCFRGLDISEIIAEGKSCVIEIPTFYPAWLRLFVVDLIIAHILYGRMYRQEKSDDVEVIIYLDEADQDLNVAASDAAYADHYSILAQLLRMGREVGITCVVGLGVIGQASKYVSSSFRQVYAFSMTEGEQRALAARTLALPPGAGHTLFSMPPGQCILLDSMSGWPHPMLCQIDYLPPHRGVLDIQYDACPFVPSKRLRDLPEVQEALRQYKAERDSEQLKLFAAPKEMPSKLPPRDLKVLLTAAAHPWWPFHAIETQAGLTLTPQARIAIRRDLKDLGYVELGGIRMGKSDVVLLSLTDKGWETAACQRPQRVGRGSIGHQHVAHWVEMAAAKEGLKAVCEHELGSHPIDCAVTGPDGRIHAHEVVVDCEANLLHHITTLSQCPSIATIVVVCLQKQIAARLRRELSAHPLVAALGDRLRWELAESFYRRLWP